MICYLALPCKWSGRRKTGKETRWRICAWAAHACNSLTVRFTCHVFEIFRNDFFQKENSTEKQISLLTFCADHSHSHLVSFKSQVCTVSKLISHKRFTEHAKITQAKIKSEQSTWESIQRSAWVNKASCWGASCSTLKLCGLVLSRYLSPYLWFEKEVDCG